MRLGEWGSALIMVGPWIGKKTEAQSEGVCTVETADQVNETGWQCAGKMRLCRCEYRGVLVIEVMAWVG